MADSALLPILAALGGVALAQAVAMLQSWLDRKNKREILLRTKYEELGQHFLASIEMPGRLLKCTTHEEIQGALHQTAASQAQLLALIYFPPLREPVRRYIVSYQNLCLAVTNRMPLLAEKVNRRAGGLEDLSDAGESCISLQNTFLKLYQVMFARCRKRSRGLQH